MPPDPQDKPSPLAAALMEMIELLKPIVEAVDGFRADAERRGYSPAAAETMALELHRMLMAKIIKDLVG